MASLTALGGAIQALLDNGNRVPEGTTAQRIGKHWAAYLGDVQDDELAAAMHELIKTRWASSWPTIGAILAHVPRNKSLRRLEALDDADETFGEVLEIVRSRGFYHTPGEMDYHDDPARSRAIAAGVRAAGGWRLLCQGDERDMPSRRAAFRAAYRSSKEKADILGEWKPALALPNMGPNGSGGPVSIAGILEHLEIGN